MVVFEIHYNFLIVLPIPLKTYRSGIVLSFTKQKACARKIGRVSEVFASPISIGRAICPGLQQPYKKPGQG